MRLEHQRSTGTIRQQPQNYLIAHWADSCWICDPDLAADPDLAVAVFRELLKFEHKYDPDAKFLETAL
jgi:hypothetical protein